MTAVGAIQRDYVLSATSRFRQMTAASRRDRAQAVTANLLSPSYRP